MPVAKSDLRLISQEELALGEPLPGDLRDSDGYILLAAGSILQAKDLQELGSRANGELYVGPEWCGGDAKAVNSPDAVVDEIFERHGGRKPATEERSRVRYPWRVPLTVVLEEPQKHDVIAREIKVVTADISRRGFAFYYRQYIALGTYVQAQFDSLPDRPRLAAVVRNCRLIEGTRHRIGAQFIRPTKHKQTQ